MTYDNQNRNILIPQRDGRGSTDLAGKLRRRCLHRRSRMDVSSDDENGAEGNAQRKDRIHQRTWSRDTMRQEIDISGQRFGRLTAIRRDGIGECWQSKWLCLCDCGKTVSVFKCNLTTGKTRSCGCLRAEQLRQRNHDKTTLGYGEAGKTK